MIVKWQLPQLVTPLLDAIDVQEPTTYTNGNGMGSIATALQVEGCLRLLFNGYCNSTITVVLERKLTFNRFLKAIACSMWVI